MKNYNTTTKVFKKSALNIFIVENCRFRIDYCRKCVYRNSNLYKNEYSFDVKVYFLNKHSQWKMN